MAEHTTKKVCIIAIHDLCATYSLNSIVPHSQLDDGMASQGHTTQVSKKQVRQRLEEAGRLLRPNFECTK